MGKERKRIDIKKEIRPAGNEITLMDNHSLLNLFNVLEKQLEGLNALVRDEKLKSYSQLCVNILMVISEENLDKQLPEIEKEMNDLSAYVKELADKTPQHRAFFNGILDTIEVAHVRLKEFNEDRFAWRQFPVGEFQSTLNQFLSATEKVSRGKFHFVFPPEEISPLSYRINFQIDAQGDHLMAPPILHDTIRDIVANARKYSPPGTEINILLKEITPTGIQLSVSDGGIGVPHAEIEKIVEYGYRATNALDRSTMGAGIGLTKAYLLSQKFGGEFSIESGEGQGTEIRLSMFKPA